MYYRLREIFNSHNLFALAILKDGYVTTDHMLQRVSMMPRAHDKISLNTFYYYILLMIL